jgi:misacylated tRNA(Ala) deacylase
VSEPSEELYATDAYLRSFEARVVEVDAEQRRVRLDRTAMYPGGGGQPPDVGSLRWSEGLVRVHRVSREGPAIWHWLEAEDALPDPGAEALGELDWDRRHALMRTHTALHMLCGVIWHEFRVAVTGGNMEPGKGRLDFALDAMSSELAQRVQHRLDEELERAREVRVAFVGRGEADEDPALIRTKANLIPAHIDPLRVIDIVGLDKQADCGTHVASTREVGRIEVTKTESKGRDNKRIRIVVHDAEA